MLSLSIQLEAVHQNYSCIYERVVVSLNAEITTPKKRPDCHTYSNSKLTYCKKTVSSPAAVRS